MARLLREVSSQELSAWQMFFLVERRVVDEQRRRSREDAEILGEDG